ncbi:hypothetical protein VAEU17_4290338 [Vibrio aestuarianus]|nr:hypothetical protein VAEU17_4290338 [Vibrio aestuarianus]
MGWQVGERNYYCSLIEEWHKALAYGFTLFRVYRYSFYTQTT